MARAASTALAVVLGVSILAPLALAGRIGWWAFPASGTAALEAIPRALVVTLAVLAGLVGFARSATLPSSRSRAGARVAVLAVLTLVFRLAAVEAPIGDWEALLKVGAIPPVGKWYGVGLLFEAAYVFVGRAVGLDALATVRWCSAAAGAAGALLFERAAARLGLPAVLRGWPFLYAAAFGVVGVGLGHAEIYAVVCALLSAVLLSGLALLDGPRPSRGAVFGALAGAGFASYLGLVLVAPLWLALVAVLFVRAAREKARGVAVAAALALAVPALVTPAILAAGPRPLDRPMAGQWAHQVGGGDQLNARRVPPHLPRDVHWSLAKNLVAPKYWLSAWMVRDTLQTTLLGDRAGIVLAAVVAASLARRRRAALATPRIAWLAGACAAYAVLAVFAVRGYPAPYDADMAAPWFVTTTFLAAALLATAGAGWRYPRTVDVLLAAVAVAAQWSGAMLYLDTARPPADFGPPELGLSVGVAPPSVRVPDDGAAYVAVWLRNARSTPFEFGPGDSGHILLGEGGKRLLQGELHARSDLVPRTIAPGGALCISLVPVTASELRAARPGAAREADPGEPAPPGAYDAQWLLEFAPDRSGASIVLHSPGFPLVLGGPR